MTLKLRLAEPWETRPLRCHARRGRYAKLRCELPALHAWSWSEHHHHMTRDSWGRWIWWWANHGSG